ncbi:hypothetical protein AB205_0018490, partial [Aquarana catesbeiana]
FYCSTSSNVSECKENTDNNETETVQEGEQATQEGEGQSQSVDQTARPSSLQRSIHVSHDRPTTSRSSRRGKKPENPEMDEAMKSLMDEMTSFKRQETKDPFCDPNNSNASFLRTICHTPQKAPAARQMEIHMGIFNYVGGCIRAAESGMPLPTISQYEAPQRSYCQYSYESPCLPAQPYLLPYPQTPVRAYSSMHNTQRPSYASSPAHSSQGTYPQSVYTSSNSADASEANKQTSSGSSSQNSTSYSLPPTSFYQDL